MTFWKKHPIHVVLSCACTAGMILCTAAILASDRVIEDDSSSAFQGMEIAKHNVGPDKCGECHEAELASWKESAHQVSYSSMHKSDLGKSISKALGIRRVKKDDSCVRCHYNQVISREKPKVKHGVTCESCHGPAKDWLALHDDFGGDGKKRADEAPDHRLTRHKQLSKAGMKHPGQIYHLAARCFSCHVMDESRLIDNNVGHPIGDQFELLTWSQGEVRHNFVTGGGKTNAEADQKHKRVLFILGQILDVEYSLRALATAEAGDFFSKTSARINKGKMSLGKIVGSIPDNSKLTAAMAALNSLQLEVKNPEILKAQKLFMEAGMDIASRSGDQLGFVDSILPKSDAYRGKSH